MILLSLHDYLPLDDLAKIVLVGLGVAIVAPLAASIAITGFEAQERAGSVGHSRTLGDMRVGLGALILLTMIAIGIYAVANP
jgi:hypothetical protein